MSSCVSQRQASEVSSDKFQVSSVEETRDSLREEISQNLNENLTEHEVVTWTIVQEPGDTVKVERVTDRTRETGSKFQVQGSKVEVRTEVVRDTVYVERIDTVKVSISRLQVADSARASPAWVKGLKWLFFVLLAIVTLIIIIRIKR